jgi:hypothetical protein
LSNFGSRIDLENQEIRRIICECGHEFKGEFTLCNGELVVPPCPDCLDDRDNQLDKLLVDRENSGDYIEKLQSEIKDLENAIIRLSVAKLMK